MWILGGDADREHFFCRSITGVAGEEIAKPVPFDSPSGDAERHAMLAAALGAATKRGLRIVQFQPWGDGELLIVLAG